MSELKATLTASNTLIGTLSFGADYYKGDAGDSGVHIGESAPTDEEKTIWIEPTGEVSEFVMTKDEVKDYINEALGVVENGTY